MQVYHSEEEQIEFIKQWWRQHGSLFISTIIITVLIMGAWRFWQYRQDNRRTRAAVIYQALQTPASTTAAKMSHLLLKQYKGTLYAEFAAFKLAANAAAQEDWATTERFLKWNIEHARHAAIRHLARVRLASLALMQKQPKRALKLLDSTQDVQHSFWGNWLRGKAYWMQGDMTQAHHAFMAAQRAMQNAKVNYAFDASEQHNYRSKSSSEKREQRVIFQTLLASYIQRTQPHTDNPSSN